MPCGLSSDKAASLPLLPHLHRRNYELVVAVVTGVEGGHRRAKKQRIGESKQVGKWTRAVFGVRGGAEKHI